MAKAVTPTLQPATAPTLTRVPSASGPADTDAMRCPGCNRLVFVLKSILDACKGATTTCPICGGPVKLPE